MLSARAWREWARRWNIRDFPSGELPLAPEVQPVLLLDDVTRLAMKPQRYIVSWGGFTTAAVVGQYSTCFISSELPYMLRSFEFTIASGQIYYGLPAAALGLGSAEIVNNHLERPLTNPFGTTTAPACELDYGETATLAHLNPSMARTTVRYSGLDYVYLPGQNICWQAQNANVLMTINHVEIELFYWPGWNEIENQPFTRP